MRFFSKQFISMQFILLLLCLPLTTLGATLHQHEVLIEGHPMALWSKTIESPKATILLLHGRTYSSLPDFDLQVEGEHLSFMDSLNDLGFDVYALDGRGYGKTPRDSSGWLTPTRHAADVIEVIKWINKRIHHRDQKSIQNLVHVYGWSYGSMITQFVAQQAPEIMASITLFGYPINPENQLSGMTYPDKPPAKKNTVAHASSDFITKGTISQAAIDQYVEAALAADPLRVDFKNLEEWLVLDPAKVTLPTLLIQAEFDPLALTPVHANAFTKFNTAKKWWIVLKGGDHAALLETPREEMLSVMDAFISSLL